MKRSNALALPSVALFLASSVSASSQTIRTGQQCVPAVSNPSMYHNCRLRIVRGNEVCRCAILPQAQRQVNRMDRQNDRDVIGTGSLGNFSPATSGQAGTVTGNRGAGQVGSGVAVDRRG